MKQTKCKTMYCRTPIDSDGMWLQGIWYCDKCWKKKCLEEHNGEQHES